MPKPSLTIQTAMPSIAPNNKDHLVLLTVHHPKQPALTPVRQKLNIAFAIDVSGSMSGCLQGVWKEVPVAPLETALHRGGLQPHPRPVFIGSPYIGTPHIGTPHVGTPMQPWDPNVVPMTPSPSAPGLPGLPLQPQGPVPNIFPVPTTKRVGVSKLDRVKQAVSEALDVLQPDDRFSIVVFDGQARVIQTSTLATASAKERAKALLQELHPGSSTALHAGWSLAAQSVAQALASDTVNRVLLLTDGEASDGITDAATLAQNTAHMAIHGISTSTFGVGDHFNEDLLQAMAESGDGRYVYLEKAGQYGTVFQDEFQGLSRAYGRAATLRGLASVECEVDFLNDLPVQNNAWKLPNPQYDKEEHFLLKITPKNTAEPFNVDITYTYTTAQGDISVSIQHHVGVVSDKTYGQYKVNDTVAKKQLELDTARAKAKAMQALDQGDLVRSRSILAASANAIVGSAYAEEFSSTTARLDTLMSTQDTTKLRKMATYDAYSTRIGDSSGS